MVAGKENVSKKMQEQPLSGLKEREKHNINDRPET